MRPQPIFRFTLFLLCLLCLCLIPAQAQDDDIVLTLRLTRSTEYLEENHVFDYFEEENPGVRVHVTYMDCSAEDMEECYYLAAVYDRDAHLNGADAYTMAGDVLMVSVGGWIPPSVSLETTRTGYFLDLAPLIQIDETFNPDDFYPATWEAVQWDGGIWALPVTAHVYTVIYDPAAFDGAGLSYPDETWTLDHYAHAIEELTPRDNTGQALLPGFMGFNFSDFGLFYALLGQGAYDDALVPSPPWFDRPEFVTFFEQWAQLIASGAVYNPEYDYADDWSPADIPFTIDRLQDTLVNSDSGAPLPRGEAWITVTGVAVSSRTPYPEEAYALAKWLANDPRVADSFVFASLASTTARAVYPEVDPIENAPYMMGSLSEENAALQETALHNGITYPQVRYLDYVQNVLWAMPETVDVQGMLQEAQQAAENRLVEADRRREYLSGMVPPPPPEVVLVPGEIALNFWVNNMNSVMDQGSWQRFIDDFVAGDTEVGHITLSMRSESLPTDAAQADCFYTRYNAVPRLDLSTIINLDPLMSADASFNADHFLTGALAQVQRDNHIWAYPLDVVPKVLWYDPEAFALAGLSAPVNGWTVDGFSDALQQLSSSDTLPAFGAMDYGTSLLMLVAAYGGLPIDFRSDPVTVDFSSAESVEAIRQVLDLVRSEEIYYESIIDWGGRLTNGREPMFANGLVSVFNRDGFLPVTFPKGHRYLPVDYELGTAYINADSPYPEACYRVISGLSDQPELLFGMPVKRSLADDPTAAVAHGQDLSEFYNEFEAMLDSPNLVVFPANSSGPSDFIVQYWLFRAFDRIVLEGGNLEAELGEAERFTVEYLECAGNVPLLTARQSYREYYQQFEDCAIGVDPTSQSYFAFGE